MNRSWTVAAAFIFAMELGAATPKEAEQMEVERLAVMVDCAHADAHGVGIIFAVDGDGALIATAGHVVLPCAKEALAVEIRFAGSKVPVNAEVLKYEKSPVDLGVVRVSGLKALKINVAELPFARLGDAEVMARGDSVFALGREWVTNLTAEPITRKSADSLQFQSNTARPGSSGGPLLNDRSQIVGMVRDIGPYGAEATSIQKILATLKEWKYPIALRSLPYVSAGNEHTCQVRSNGSARCWDDSSIGLTAARGTEAEVIPGIRFKSVSVGGNHSCGVAFDGTAYCWGSNSAGQLGGGSKAKESSSPAPILGLKFASVSAGGWHSCGLTTEGHVYCWGAGGAGRLGNDSNEDSAVPVLVAGGLTFAYVSAGTANSCAVTGDGDGYCWGGMGGTGIDRNGADPANAFVPLSVPGKLVFTKIDAGGFQSSTCGLTTTGAVYCWGEDAHEIRAKSLAPTLVCGKLTFKFIHQGLGQHRCGVASDGAAYCWGSNSRGQLGDGSTKDSESPVRVAGGLTFASVTAGMLQSCGVTTDGDTFCWGAKDLYPNGGSAVPVRMADAN